MTYGQLNNQMVLHCRIGPSDVRSKMIELFKGDQHLLLGFNKFLPEGSKITLESDQTLPKKPEFHQALDFVRKVKVTTFTHSVEKWMDNSINDVCFFFFFYQVFNF